MVESSRTVWLYGVVSLYIFSRVCVGEIFQCFLFVAVVCVLFNTSGVGQPMFFFRKLKQMKEELNFLLPIVSV